MKSCLICDDHELVCDAMASLIAQAWPNAKVQQVYDFSAAFEAAQTNLDLIIVDLFMPGAEPLDGVSKLLSHCDNTPIIVLTGVDNDALMLALFDAGVRGFVPKFEPVAVLEGAIKLVLAGGTFLPPRLLDLVKPGNNSSTKADSVQHLLASLTRQQHRVVNQLLEGKTNKEIAQFMGVAPSTIKSHLDSVYAKLGVGSRAQVRDLLRSR